MDSQQCRIQEDATVEWIPFAVVMFGNKWDSHDVANIVSSSMNMHNILTERTNTISSIVRACDIDVSHPKRTDGLKHLLN